MKAEEYWLEKIFGVLFAKSARASETNALCSILLPAPTGGSRICLTTLEFGYSDAPTGGQITILEGPTPVFTLPVTAAGAGQIILNREYTPATAITVTLSAGGSGIVGHLDVGYCVVK